jgi:2-polyprenyl-3-methyl-5-hydroxy-6-metoxy-1,4-benzoquinol methylase
MSSSASFLDPIILPLIVGETVLDVGCGYGRWGHLIRTNFWEAWLPSAPAVDGFDAFEGNVEACRRYGGYRRVWQQQLPSPLEGRWDTVLACEVIEHLPPEHVDDVITQLESVAARRIIFSTPNWPYFRGGDDTAYGYNEFEAHHSYVSRDTFKRRGYAIEGAGFGLNPTLRITRLVRRLGLSGALELLPRRIPAWGDVIVAHKNLA